MGVMVGHDCRILTNPISCFGSEPYLVTLGNHVTVTAGVSFITHDGGVWIFRQQYPDVDCFAPITVGNNVFIGFRATILPGVVIGDNCVIGAASLVSRSIPSGNVAVGVPARCIMTVDEYWAKLQNRITHIRFMDSVEKQVYLERHFSMQRRTPPK
jgi:acetyltransferase-like isoleucine patch superfamily enzyme